MAGKEPTQTITSQLRLSKLGAESAVALAGTLFSATLLVLTAIHAGPLWRDEVNTVNLAAGGGISVSSGSNLTATKARLLLMAALLKLGCLPPAADPDRPTPAERDAVRKKVAEYQAIFDTH